MISARRVDHVANSQSKGHPRVVWTPAADKRNRSAALCSKGREIRPDQALNLTILRSVCSRAPSRRNCGQVNSAYEENYVKTPELFGEFDTLAHPPQLERRGGETRHGVAASE